MPDLSSKRSIYVPSFKLLISDFETICEYIEPTDANLTTYSHRVYELILRTCTEFESVAKDGLAAVNYPRKGDWNINDYATLEEHLGLERFEVGVAFWQPIPQFINPFKGWTTNTPRLSWYKSYNEVKHNRSTAFNSANFENLVLSLSGLFVLLAQVSVLPSQSPPATISETVTINFEGQYMVQTFGHIPLILRIPTPA